MQNSLSRSTYWHRAFILITIILVCLAFLLLLNIHISNASVNTPKATNNFPAQLGWQSQCADCPKATPNAGDHGLRIDSHNQPHLAYGGDHLYYAKFDGTTWQNEIVDSSSNVNHVSLALNQNNQPYISYSADGNLKYAFYNGYKWEIYTIDSSVNAGQYSSIALDPSGKPHISYFDSYSLKYAYYDGVNWHLATLVGIDNIATSTSIDLDTSGYPYIVYTWNYSPVEFPSSGVVDSKLEMARYDGANWQFETIEEHGSSKFLNASLELDQFNHPHIGYQFAGTVKYATKTQNNWQIETIESIYGVGDALSISLDSAGVPHILYLSGYARHAVRINNNWQKENVGYYGAAYIASIAFDSLGNPHAVYFHGQPRYLTHAHHNGSQWILKIIEEFAELGSHNSIALTSKNDIHISYRNETNGKLKYVHFDGQSWQTETIDNGGYYSSIALDQNGHPHIAYLAYESQKAIIKYAFFDGSSWQIKNVEDSLNAPASDIDLALDSNDSPHIAFTAGQLNYARYVNTIWQANVIDGSNSDVFTELSLALNSNDNPSIAYFYNDNGTNFTEDLRFAHFEASSWQTETIETDGGRYPSLLIDGLDRPHISYQANSGLFHAYLNNIEWVKENIDATTNVFNQPSLQLDASNNPHISYSQDETALRYIWFDGTQWFKEVVNEGGPHNSLVLDTNDHPYISYQNGNQLRVASLQPPPLDLKIIPSQTSGVAYEDEITVTLVLSGTGLDATLDHPLNNNLQFIDGSLSPSAQYISATHTIQWQGQLPTDTVKTIKYRVQLLTPTTIQNSQANPIPLNATLHDSNFNRSISTFIYINGSNQLFPFLVRQP